MCKCVCKAYCGVNQLRAIGPLARHSFVSSWDGVFYSSASPLATLYPWPKHSISSSSSPPHHHDYDCLCSWCNWELLAQRCKLQSSYEVENISLEHLRVQTQTLWIMYKTVCCSSDFPHSCVMQVFSMFGYKGVSVETEGICQFLSIHTSRELHEIMLTRVQFLRIKTDTSILYVYIIQFKVKLLFTS